MAGYKNYRISYSEGGNHYSKSINAISIKEAKKQLMELRPKAKIYHARLITNKNNHM